MTQINILCHQCKEQIQEQIPDKRFMCCLNLFEFDSNDALESYTIYFSEFFNSITHFSSSKIKNETILYYYNLETPAQMKYMVIPIWVDLPFPNYFPTLSEMCEKIVKLKAFS
jgi:hypothetical protein